MKTTNCFFAGFLLFGVILLVSSGCKDFLTVAPADELSREETFSTLRGTNAAVVGIYLLLGDGNYYRDKMLMYPEMAGNAQPALRPGDNLPGTGPTANTYNEAYQFTYQPEYQDNTLGSFYDYLYRCLYQINDVLANIDQLTEGSEAERNSLKGEALAMRAIVHFDLVRLFAQSPQFSSGANHPGIVIADRLPQFTDQQDRASVAEVYAFIEQDLAQAASLIDARYSQRSEGPFWLTSTVITAYQARVAAYLQAWEAVIAFTNALLASPSPIQAAPALAPADRYLEEWRTNQLSERIFALDLSRVTTPSSLGLSALIGAGISEPVLNISSDLVALYPPEDLRRELLVMTGGGGTVSDKYRLDPGNTRLPDPILLRTSELYLLRAEAYAALGRTAEAQADYNLIHQRANPGAINIDLESEALQEAIRTERRRELALEGHYLFDLSRWGQPVDRDACLEFVLTCDLDYPDYRYALPIPQAAIFNNPNLVQNEGY
ncbi:RagB/SusD family nutrient uptake outer membrane protein [Neolewinella lacunae]|uniref:RagB/SusD family nutrient uptake outer membrane protein n=1 Tax=Neolewinella lacunae TaxID=1517758 RepID=A0A923T992_9BACT|nr:RagB/SusD family nutrient uptake outer membrane protein [Neolewinella lacunae]MBC6994813.1 RagB/SusD family nutrient uptake outer membrane protein [Neolewinella lacunae]MDN3634435.1 RagB/SusD family nutrient uptake outer membrane protein [Neolewinella lacunae]